MVKSKHISLFLLLTLSRQMPAGRVEGVLTRIVKGVSGKNSITSRKNLLNSNLIVLQI